MDNERLRELAGLTPQQLNEKFENYTREQLIDELWGQLKNMQHFIPSRDDQDAEQKILNEKQTYRKIAQNIIDIIDNLKQGQGRG